MSRSVIVSDVGVVEDVVDRSDSDLVPSLPQDSGHMVRWWSGFGRSHGSGLNHAQEVDTFGAVAERLDYADGSNMEPGSGGGHELVVVKKKLWRFRHLASPIRLDPALVPRLLARNQRAAMT